MVIYIVQYNDVREDGLLTKNGERKAQEFRQKFLKYPIDLCFSSTLKGSMQTAFTLAYDRCLILKDDKLNDEEKLKEFVDDVINNYSGKNILVVVPISVANTLNKKFFHCDLKSESLETKLFVL